MVVQRARLKEISKTAENFLNDRVNFIPQLLGTCHTEGSMP